MNEDKINLKFGVGKVLIGVLCNSLLFEISKNSVDVGSRMPLDAEVIEKHTLPFYSLSEVSMLQSMISDVYNGVEVVRYKNFIFDFTTYNLESVNIFYEQLTHVKENLMHLIAV